MNASGYGCDVMDANKEWPEKMSKMGQEQLEEVPKNVSVRVRVIAAMSRYGTYQDMGNEGQFSGENKLTSEHSSCAKLENPGEVTIFHKLSFLFSKYRETQLLPAWSLSSCGYFMRYST